jgi:hypothetical protein
MTPHEYNTILAVVLIGLSLTSLQARSARFLRRSAGLLPLAVSMIVLQPDWAIAAPLCDAYTDARQCLDLIERDTEDCVRDRSAGGLSYDQMRECLKIALIKSGSASDICSVGGSDK